MSLEELQNEARVYGIDPANNREECLKQVMDHLEKYGPLADARRIFLQNTTQADAPSRPATPQSFHTDLSGQEFFTTRKDPPVTDTTINQLCTVMREQARLQHEMMLQLISTLSNNPGLRLITPSQADPQPASQPQQSPQTRQRRLEEESPAATAQSTKFLASQIPVFGALEDEDVELWVEKIESVANMHNLSQVVMFSAATTRLVKTARRWFDISTGDINRSWLSFRTAILDRFKRNISRETLKARAEARRWNSAVETFSDYAMEKQALMRSLKLEDEEAIQMLIRGINEPYIRCSATVIRADTLNQFLREMQLLTANCVDSTKKPSFSSIKADKFKVGGKFSKTGEIKGTLDKTSQPRNNNQELFCVYCRNRGHVRSDCFKLRKKEQNLKTVTNASSTVAPVKKVVSESTVGMVSYSGDKLTDVKEDTNDFRFKITRVNNMYRDLTAMLDSGSPISFIRASIANSIFKSNQFISGNNFNGKWQAINSQPVNILGVVSSTIELENIPGRQFDILLYIVNDNSFPVDIIIGRDFVDIHLININYRPSLSERQSRIRLFQEIPNFYDNNKHSTIASVHDTTNNRVNESRSFQHEIEIDFDINVKNQLLSVITEVNDMNIPCVDDDYTVKIALKDDSIFAYAPRRFAWAERLEIRKITDNLLERGIIRYSTSPYCARVVPVKKKNGTYRLCVDLRPLNDRIVKQKYPFPLIEDCLSRLQDKSVFTLLDLKDSFHQIKLHPDCTKYFSFATPDGQFEFTHLPFGFCESPAEFQKRIVNILQPLIREDKVIVYIDDILIPATSVNENLDILKQVLILFKKYNFELNFSKCQFLRSTIEYLGYIITPSGITLSQRHTQAIKGFPEPKNVKQLQRFLGLANYFRKFIQNFAHKTKPLQKLLKQHTKFDFNAECRQSFDSLKKELTAYPVLRLYNPHAETELHTDASASALAAILLQKTEKNHWAPIAYYSQTTNQAESRYHSYELEMLALVKSVERFHIYLYGVNFTAVTDCHALVYAINKANINPRIARWTLRLQNYTFKIIHREAKRMIHVDALSRIISYIEPMPLEKELEYKQQLDPRLKIIADELQFRDDDKFELCQGLVYRKSPVSPKFVVPDSMVNNVIRVYHDNMAHCGIEKTIQGISANYWFPSLRRKVIDHIDNCLTCLMTNTSSNVKEGDMQICGTATEFGQTFHIDHFGPLKESEGYKYILVIVDSFTRFTWLFPVRSTGTKEVLIKLSWLFNIFGNPKEIVSDRGTAFTSQEFTQFLNKYDIKHRLVAVAAPWANGLVERINRFLKASLKRRVEESSNWITDLGTIQYVINNTHHSALKASPSKILFGFEQRNHEDANLVKVLNQVAQTELNFDDLRQNHRKIAIEATDKIRNYNKIYYDHLHKKPTRYKQGDYVMIRDTVTKPGEDKKLKPNYKGPYVVAKVLNNNRYVIQDIPGFNLTAKPYDSILSPDRLKHWIKTPMDPVAN